MNPESLPLRDIHLPPAISWWPPAPGWWLLLLVVILLIIAAYKILQHRKCRHFQRLALTQLSALEEQHNDLNNTQELLQALSRLLRQTAQLHFPRNDCAGLVGEAWLTFLDQGRPDNSFSQGVGRILADGPYLSQNVEIDSKALFSVCRNWLQRLPPAPKPLRRQR
jgi:hypothetical protein